MWQFLRYYAFTFAVYVVFAWLCIGMPYPFYEIPQGTEPSGTVGLFNYWTIWWNTSLPNGVQEFWNAPIFYPTASAFVFSETQPLFVLATPIAWCMGTTAVYNLFLITSLALNGISLLFLCRRLYPQTRLTPWVTGTVGVALPFVHWQIGVLQLVPVWGIVWTLSAVHRLRNTQRRFVGLELGVAFSITYLLCNNYGLMLALLLGPMLLSYLSRSVFRRTILAQLLVAAVVVVAITAPVVFTQLTVLSSDSYNRTAAGVAELSAQIPDYTVVPWGSRLGLLSLLPWLDQYQWRLSPGYMLYGLASAAILLPIRLRRHRGWYRLLLTMIVGAVGFSVLPTIPIAGVPLYQFLSDAVPGFGKIRSFMRFGLFMQIGVVLLATVTLAAAELALTRRRDRKSLSFVAIVCITTVLAFIEVWPVTGAMTKIPWSGGTPPFAEWLNQHAHNDDAVACFPFPQSKRADDFEYEVHWMLTSQFHRCRLVNGYSGFFPKHYVEFKERAAKFPAIDVVSELAEIEVDFIVVKADWLIAVGQQMDDVFAHSQLSHCFTDQENQVSIFSILPNRESGNANGQH